VIKDVKIRTWVTRENFKNMHENISATMLKQGWQRNLPNLSRMKMVCQQNTSLSIPNMAFL
jgi:hypothetical protein